MKNALKYLIFDKDFETIRTTNIINRRNENG